MPVPWPTLSKSARRLRRVWRLYSRIWAMPAEVSVATSMGDAQPPEDWREATLSSVAEVRFSSVDKITRPSEKPVRLCNYVDVYENNYITGDLEFMQASATQPEIVRFGLQV